jgi:hypothetical protein
MGLCVQYRPHGLVCAVQTDYQPIFILPGPSPAFALLGVTERRTPPGQIELAWRGARRATARPPTPQQHQHTGHRPCCPSSHLRASAPRPPTPPPPPQPPRHAARPSSSQSVTAPSLAAPLLFSLSFPFRSPFVCV